MFKAFENLIQLNMKANKNTIIYVNHSTETNKPYYLAVMTYCDCNQDFFVTHYFGFILRVE